MLTWPVVTLSVLLIILSGILTMFILLHKGKGGGMGDLFGGGMTNSMGGASVAERNLDRFTVVIGALWVLVIVALLMIYRFGDALGTDTDPSANPSATVSAPVTPGTNG
jgi:preprotein translocase subunit SecG